MRRRYVVLLINAANEIAHVASDDNPIPDSHIQTVESTATGELEKFRVVRLEVDSPDHIRAREWIDNLTVAPDGTISAKPGFRGRGFEKKEDRDERPTP